MSLYSRLDQAQRDQVDQLVDEYRQQGVSRRTFLQRAAMIGLSTSAAITVLAACGGGATSTTTVTSLNVLSVWGGEEQASFKATVAPFAQRTGVTIKLESTRDLDAVLTSRIQGNNPPDIAVLPNPGKMKQLASQGKLIALDSFLDANKLHSDYAQAWLDLGTSNGKLYALFYKAANKATVWYNPTQFQSNGYQIPQTWDDLLALSDHIASSGKYPWSLGVESGAASGWPATDWIAQIYLNESGPDAYDKWVAHATPWTDASVKSAFQKFGKIAGGKHYINGAPQSILATSFQNASYPLFKTPPTAYLYYLGDFTAGFITGQFPTLKPGQDFNFFPFPSITSTYQGGVTGGADVIVALKNNSAVGDFVKYLATAEAQTIWVKRGGFTSPNKSVDLSAYPNDVARTSAKQLTTASAFRFGAGDIMPPAVQQAWWKGALTFIGDQSQLDSVLSNLESVAQQAYHS